MEAYRILLLPVGFRLLDSISLPNFFHAPLPTTYAITSIFCYLLLSGLLPASNFCLPSPLQYIPLFNTCSLLMSASIRRSADPTERNTSPLPARNPSPMPVRGPSPMPAPPSLLSKYDRNRSPIPTIRPRSSSSDLGPAKSFTALRMSSQGTIDALSAKDLQSILATCPKHDHVLRLLKLLHTTIATDEAMKAKRCLLEVMHSATYSNCYIELFNLDRQREVNSLIKKVREGAAQDLSNIKKQSEKAAAGSVTDPCQRFQKSRCKETYLSGIKEIEESAKKHTADLLSTPSLKHVCVYDDTISADTLIQKLNARIDEDVFNNLYTKFKDRLSTDPKYGDRFTSLATDADKQALMKKILLEEVIDYEFFKGDYDTLDPVTKKRIRYFVGGFTATLKGALDRAIENPFQANPKIALLTELATLYATLKNLYRHPILIFSRLCELQPDWKEASFQLQLDCTTPRSFEARLAYTHFIYATFASAQLPALELPETFEIEWSPAENPTAKKKFVFHLKSLMQMSEDAFSGIWPLAAYYHNICLSACLHVTHILENFEKLSPPLSEVFKERLGMIHSVFNAQAVALNTIIPPNEIP